MSDFATAGALLRQFKGDAYVHGQGILPRVGAVAARHGRRAVLVADAFPGSEPFRARLRQALSENGVTLAAEVSGAAPNAPREDLDRIAAAFRKEGPDVIISFGGGSTIDCTKAAEVLRTLGGGIDGYFGTGLVAQALAQSGKTLTPHVAVQTAASSGAHLTKYSNITDVHSGQKKLIVDMAIVPASPVFDYAVTLDAPRTLTADGALDGISHCLEVLFSAVGKPEYEKVAAVAAEGIRLVITYLPQVLASPGDAEGREALGLATDLGGYAIMLGGTSGPHLTSFSLVDVLSHGRACGLLNPYYMVFFAPAIAEPLRMVGSLFAQAGYADAGITALEGRELGMGVAGAMIAFEQAIGFPTRLQDVPGFSDAHIIRALAAAKDPQLKMKLENMPIPMTADMVDVHMGSVLVAAKTGDLSLVRNVD